MRTIETIGIQPFGEFDASLVDTIQQTISEFFEFQTVILPSKPLPQSAFVNIKKPRYRADTLLRILKREKPDSIQYVLGLASKDISTTKRDAHSRVKKPEAKYSDWGVFGLGYRPGPSCIVSTFRLQTSDRETFVQRLKKICVHELGHNLGLRHCESDENCVMRDAAETIKTIDLVELNLCESCRAIVDNH